MLYRRNLLNYPVSRQAGVDPTHLASKALRFSGIASGANFVNLLTGRPGAVQFTPVFALDGVMGPAFNSFNANDQTNFTNQPTTNDASITIAAIIRFNSVAATQVIVSTSSGNTGWRFLTMAGVLQLTAGGVADLASSITLAANIPYFLVASANALAANFLAFRLDTGQAVTYTRAGATVIAPNGIYVIGGMNAFGQCANGKMAAAAISANFLSLDQMQAWARDPWSFWYPPRDLFVLPISSAPLVVSGTLAATEAPDIAAFTGSAGGATGSLAAIEAADFAALTGTIQLVPAGILTASETADIVQITMVFAAPPPETGVPYPAIQDYGWKRREPPVPKIKGRRG